MSSEYFYEITQDRVLDAVEKSGFLTTGRVYQLNSFENRVYEIELEESFDPKDERFEFLSIQPKKIVAKFYRPGRWTKEQILEEHKFLLELLSEEIPAVAPLKLSNDSTVDTTHEVYFSLFPKIGGRAPEDFQEDDLKLIGRLLGRIHNVGERINANHRIALNQLTYGKDPLNFLLNKKTIPASFENVYSNLCGVVIQKAAEFFDGKKIILTHGDCHKGNLLWNKSSAFFIDFDDCIRAPAVQDFWLLHPARDEETKEQLNQMIEAYSTIRSFDSSELKGIEILRALRIIHFSAWIARRWEDPIFPRAFPQFQTIEYWRDEIRSLSDILELI